jgi:uncharacterized protein YcgI (DUF1989 family)
VSQPLLGRMAIKTRTLHPGEGAAFEVKTGQLLQILTVSGKQVADFVAFSLADRAEYLSTSMTRAKNNSLMLQANQKLYSNRRNELLQVVEDTVGRHDLLFPACDPQRYKQDYDIEDHPNCKTALATALADYDVSFDQIPDPVNWFMNMAIVQKGEFEIRESLAERNDYVVVQALTDVVVAISACPQDQNPVNAGKPTDILVRLFK